MLAKLTTFPLIGIEAVPVEVEVDVSPSGLPKTILVGLPEAAVKESTHRVERAMVNSGFQRPQSRVVINLVPAYSLRRREALFRLAWLNQWHQFPRP
jgi:magnesium chelatase family protein